MTPEELHRAVIRAVAFGDLERERRLRRRFRGLDHDSAADYLYATAAVCLAHRFGEVATPERVGRGRAGSDHVVLGCVGLDLVDSDRPDSGGTGSGHADSGVSSHGRTGLGRAAPDRAVLDHAELGRFMAELRSAGPALCPPSNFLEVEAVVRGLCGEPHLIEEVGARRQREALAFVLRYLADALPEIREDFDAVVDRAQVLQRRWLVGPAADEPGLRGS